jgi:hypothetical protein
MFQLIGILAMLGASLYAPFEVHRIRSGWTPKRFEANRERFLNAYRRQLLVFAWAGAVIGTVSLVLGLLQSDPSERISSFVLTPFAYLLAVVSGISRSAMPRPNSDIAANIKPIEE